MHPGFEAIVMAWAAFSGEAPLDQSFGDGRGARPWRHARHDSDVMAHLSQKIRVDRDHADAPRKVGCGADKSDFHWVLASLGWPDDCFVAAKQAARVREL